MADELDDVILDLASSPAQIEVDGQSVREQPLKDVLDARDRLAATAAAARKTRGLRFTKLVPSGGA